MITVLQNQGHTAVSNRFLSAYMPRAEAGAVKVYLYGLMLSQTGAAAFDMAGALGMAEADVVNALQYWQGQGLLRLSPGDPPKVRYLEPGEAAAMADSAAYTEFNRKLQAIFGSQVLYEGERRKIYDAMSVYGLEEDCALLLAEHCRSQNEETGYKRFNPRQFEAAAQVWAQMGLTTKEKAESFLQSQSAFHAGTMEVLRRLGKRRAPTEAELALYKKWTEVWGYEPEAVLLSCDALTAFGTPSFKALDGVLENYRREGAVSLEALRAAMGEEERQAAFALQLYDRLGLKARPTLQQRQQIELWRGVWAMPDELLLFAADSAFGTDKPFLRCRDTLEDLRKQGISRVEDAKAALAKKKAAPTKKSRALDYMQRKRPTDDSFIINLDD